MSDSDAWITADTGWTAKEIVTRHGMEYLHDLEAPHLFAAAQSSAAAVVAAAARVADAPDCRGVVATLPVLWLDATPAVLVQRFAGGPHRPQYNQNRLAMLTAMHARRSANFASVATWRIDADRPVTEVAATLLRVGAELADEVSETTRHHEPQTLALDSPGETP
ncbi:MAG: 3-dehydroquinate synthase [Streptosporangiaceae bacterium]|nr:3-dehydroquinate synthase [Streptosporangiaceae bacterium]